MNWVGFIEFVRNVICISWLDVGEKFVILLEWNILDVVFYLFG